jgi:hypothetical protein
MNPNEPNVIHINPNNHFYNKLVDLYAGHELPEELEADLMQAGAQDPALSLELHTMRQTVDLLHQEEAPEFTEESYQRILLKLYARGVQLQKQTPDPFHLQYQLPIQG